MVAQVLGNIIYCSESDHHRVASCRDDYLTFPVEHHPQVLFGIVFRNIAQLKFRNFGIRLEVNLQLLAFWASVIGHVVNDRSSTVTNKSEYGDWNLQASKNAVCLDPRL